MLTPLLLALPVAVQGSDPPQGYYDAVDESSQAALRASLHQIIDDHVLFPYTSGSTDTWNILELADQDPSNSSRVIDVYRNRSFAKQGGGNSNYNREHVWPTSYGFPDNNGQNFPFVDCHMLRICDGGYNSSRSNKPFGNCTGGCNELTTDANNGVGGGSGTFPGNSNWTAGAFTNGTFQVNPMRKGDIARALFYAAIRYEGGTHGSLGIAEPDLILTDNLGLIAASNTGSNESVAYMGRLATLLVWHLDDPVDEFERRRNGVVASFQGNRNPFVDHPEWVACAFTGDCDPGFAYCSPNVTNSSGGPAYLTAVGSASIAENDFRLLLAGLPAQQFGFVVCSRQTGIVFNPGGAQGNLCLGGEIGRAVGGVIFNGGFFGTADVLVDLNDLPQPSGSVAAMAGETWNFQAWFRDVAGGAATSNFSDAWQVTWQ